MYCTVINQLFLTVAVYWEKMGENPTAIYFFLLNFYKINRLIKCEKNDLVGLWETIDFKFVDEVSGNDFFFQI